MTDDATKVTKSEFQEKIESLKKEIGALSYNEKIEYAKKAGKHSFHNDGPSVPHHSICCNAVLKMGNVKEFIAFSSAYAKAWVSENASN